MKGIIVKADQSDLDYVKATIETLDLIELFLIRLNSRHRLDEFASFLQAFIGRSQINPKSDNSTDIPFSDSMITLKL